MAKKTNENICPYCGTPLTQKKNIYNNDILCCGRYPECDSYVLIGGNKDIGLPGNKFVRLLRIRAHTIYDIIYKAGIENRKTAYQIMGQELHRYGKHAHFRYANVYECLDSIFFAIQFIAKNYPSVKSHKKLTAEQVDLFMLIANLDVDIDSRTYENEDLLKIIQLIYNRGNVEAAKVSRRTGACGFWVYSVAGNVMDRKYYFFRDKSTIRNAVYSLTKSLYDEYAKTYGFPPLETRKQKATD